MLGSNFLVTKIENKAHYFKKSLGQMKIGLFSCYTDK